MTLPPELVEAVVVTGLYLVVLGTAIFVVQAFVKHALKSLSWTCLDSPAGQVLLRGVPLLGGATVGVSIFGALWPEPIAAMLGLIAGAQARALHRAGRSIGSGLAHRLLVTSEARGEGDTAHGDGPWSAGLAVPFGAGGDLDLGTILAGVAVGVLLLGAWALRTLLGRPPAPRSEADVAHDRAAEALRRAEEERGRDYADQMAAEEAAEIGDAVGMPTETEAERKARLDRLIWGDRKRRQR